MTRPFLICATIAMMLLATLLPVQAASPTGCAGTPVVQDICPAPGTAAPLRTGVEKPCMTGVLPASAPAALCPQARPAGAPAPQPATAPGREVPPDKRPPRA